MARWKILDRHFLKPLFGGRQHSAGAVRGYPLRPDGYPDEDDDDDDESNGQDDSVAGWASFPLRLIYMTESTCNQLSGVGYASLCASRQQITGWTR